MIRLPPRSTRTDTLLPYTTLFRSSLNDAQARVDKDGLFRAVISAQDPGVPNWLDTAGNASGAVQGRWLDCSDKPIPDTRVVKVKDIRKYLPADTHRDNAEHCEASIPERATQIRQSPTWEHGLWRVRRAGRL